MKRRAKGVWCNFFKNADCLFSIHLRKQWGNGNIMMILNIGWKSNLAALHLTNLSLFGFGFCTEQKQQKSNPAEVDSPESTQTVYYREPAVQIWIHVLNLCRHKRGLDLLHVFHIIEEIHALYSMPWIYFPMDWLFFHTGPMNQTSDFLWHK